MLGVGWGPWVLRILALLFSSVWRCGQLKFSGTLRVDNEDKLFSVFFFCDCWQFPAQPLLSPLPSSCLGCSLGVSSYLLFHVL